jgi:TPR repeat protein
MLVRAVVAGPYDDATAAYQRGDYATAMRIIQPLANRGEANAQNTLGLMYHFGQGVPQSLAEAARWYRKAADQGEADAQNSLGWVYQYTQGDYVEAVKWYRKAADQGHSAAQFNFGGMYYYGYGLLQDYAWALYWYRKAAEQGEAKALSALGVMYQNGQAVPQDYVQAYMWYNLAVSRFPASDEETLNLAITFRNELAALMTSAQIAEGQRMSERCLRSNYTDCGSPQVARREEKIAPRPLTPRNEVTSTGTGFFVSETGHIVTNAHVVEGCQTVRASRGGPLRKVSVDEESDLALYTTSEKTDAIARLRGGRGARAGESVVVVGFPLSGLLSSDPIVTTGIISALSGLRNDRRTIQITAPVQPGNSGGPLLGENGSVVGVVVSKLNAVKVAAAIGDIPQNVNFAVSLGTTPTVFPMN